jgi:hypothetical protein
MPLFTELPRGSLLVNQAAGEMPSRKLRAWRTKRRPGLLCPGLLFMNLLFFLLKESLFLPLTCDR